MSQSLKMMRGDFPPSSRETFFRLLSAQLQGETTERNREEGNMLMKSASQPPLLPLHDLFANWSGAGEAQLADVQVVTESLTHHAAWRRKQPTMVV